MLAHMNYGLDHAEVLERRREVREAEKRKEIKPACGTIGLSQPLSMIQQNSAPRAMSFWSREIAIEFWYARSVRFVSKKVDETEYAALWRAGLLRHQREGKPKPAHLPDPIGMAA